MKRPRRSITIQVVEVAGTRGDTAYEAKVKGRKGYERGTTMRDAIGGLIQTHPEMFNIKIERA